MYNTCLCIILEERKYYMQIKKIDKNIAFEKKFKFRGGALLDAENPLSLIRQHFEHFGEKNFHVDLSEGKGFLVTTGEDSSNYKDEFMKTVLLEPYETIAFKRNNLFDKYLNEAKEITDNQLKLILEKTKLNILGLGK